MSASLHGTNGLTLPDGTVVSTGRSLGRRNVLINGRFEVDQLNVGVSTTTADAAYGPDMWKLIGEDSNGKIKGQDTAISTIDYATNGYRLNGYIDCVTASKKYGFIQYVESKNCLHLRNKQVVLSFTCHVSNARLTNIKAGIVEWTSTADSITSDPVSSWGAGGTTPTLASNFAFKNTPASLAATTTPVRYSVYATLGNTFNNLAAMIWADGAANNANDIFYITDVQLEEVYLSSTSPTYTPYEWNDIGTQLTLCYRYFWRISGINSYQAVGSGVVLSATSARAYIKFPCSMRADPTFAYGGTINLYDGTASPTITSLGTSLGGTEGCFLEINATGGGLTTGRGVAVYTNTASTDYVDILSRL